MPRILELTPSAFAGWARHASVELPYPLDISKVAGPADGDRTPDDDLLDQLRTICARPRVTAFSLRALPAGATPVSLAAADADRAVLVTYDAKVSVRRIADTELVTGVVGALPSLRGLATRTLELPESGWTALLADLATGVAERVVRERLERLDIAGELAEALVDHATAPAPTGTLAAMGWAHPAAGAGQLGGAMASWYEFPAGAVLARRRVSRRGGPTRVSVEPFTPDAAMHALSDAVSVALHQVRN